MTLQSMSQGYLDQRIALIANGTIVDSVFTKDYDFLDEITEIRTSCGFRENMIREANRPFDEVDF